MSNGIRDAGWIVGRFAIFRWLIRHRALILFILLICLAGGHWSLYRDLAQEMKKSYGWEMRAKTAEVQADFYKNATIELNEQLVEMSRATGRLPKLRPQKPAELSTLPPYGATQP